MTLTDDIALYSAFFMEGFRDHDYDLLIKIHGKGCVELVSQLTQFAPFVGRLVDAAVKARDESVSFPGVFEYEVCSSFGSWVAVSMIEQRRFPDVRACQDWLATVVIEFFCQMEDAESVLAIVKAVTAAADVMPGGPPCQEFSDTGRRSFAKMGGAAAGHPLIWASLLRRFRAYFASVAQ